ncbi:MAG: co-chaperone GroES [Patescibacteria group bacterium]|jgi:chaperonin GroES|nr:co-chaperone GroES [Patescibacteria group bacterium]
MKIKPLADNILIEPEKGKVVAVGPGKKSPEGKTLPLEVKKGDTVIFTKYGPNEIKVDKKEYLIAREDDILAIIE